MTRKIFLILATVSLVGCATNKYFYNNNYPSDQQQLRFEGDHGYCLQVSYGSVPMPDVRVNTPSSYQVSGQGYDSNGGSYHYQGTSTPTNNFGNGLANGYQLGQAMNASNARGDVYQGCLIRLGWFPIPCKTCIPSRASPSEISDSATKACEMFEGRGYKKILAGDGKSAFYFDEKNLSKEGKWIVVNTYMVPLVPLNSAEGNRAKIFYVEDEFYIDPVNKLVVDKKYKHVDEANNTISEKEFTLETGNRITAPVGSIFDKFIQDLKQ